MYDELFLINPKNIKVLFKLYSYKNGGILWLIRVKHI